MSQEGLEKSYNLNIDLSLGDPWPCSMATKEKVENPNPIYILEDHKREIYPDAFLGNLSKQGKMNLAAAL